MSGGLRKSGWAGKNSPTSWQGFLKNHAACTVVHLPKRTETRLITKSDLITESDQAVSTETDKANTLNAQFQSVFSPKAPVNLKSLAQKSLQDLHDSGVDLPFQPSPYPKMPDISISAEGIDKLLLGLNPHKAAGPDKSYRHCMKSFLPSCS